VSKFEPKKYTERLKEASLVVSKTKKASLKREQFESSLVLFVNQNEKEHSLESYLLYINFEKKQLQSLGSGFVLALYERAVVKHSFDPYIWISYIGFLATQETNSKEMSALCTRAIKNSFHCLTNATLWSYRLRYAFLEGNSEEFDKVYQRGMYFVGTTGDVNQINEFMLTVLYLQKQMILKKQTNADAVRQVFRDLISHLDTLHDPNYTVHRFMAHIEAFHLDSSAVAHEMYNDMVKQPATYKVWLDWAQLAIQLHDIPKAKSIFKEAIRKPIDGMAELYDARIAFEMRYGNDDDLNEALDRIFFAKEKDSMNVKPVEKKKRERDQDMHEKKPKTEELQAKVKEQLGDINSYQVVDKANAGQMIFLDKLPSYTSIDHLLTLYKPYGRIIDCYIEPNEDCELQGFVEFQNTDAMRKAVLAGSVTIGDVQIKPNRCRPAIMKWGFDNQEKRDTVYISNLSPSCDKMVLRSMFGGVGKIKDIRLQFKNNYAFAYVQFYSEDFAKDACSLDQTEVDGKVIGVNISNPLKKTVHQVDETQLFVTNLAPSIVESDLKEVFEKFGTITDVRLLHQGIKSFAYIHFETKVLMINKEAAKHGLSLNGTLLDNRVLAVTIADPNVRTAQLKKFILINLDKKSLINQRNQPVFYLDLSSQVMPQSKE
jgi:RNA recognition motif-containing protein